MSVHFYRSNLDPFKRHTDRELWTALEKCDIKGMVSADKPIIDEYVENIIKFIVAKQCYCLCTYRSTLRQIDPISRSQMSVRPSVRIRACVRPSVQKDGVQYDPIQGQGQGQGHELFKCGNPVIFNSYLLHHLQWELARILKLEYNI